MFAQLGNIRFEGLKTPNSWDEAHSVEYGQIPHIGGKPSLQKVSDRLLQLDISARFSSDFCEPSDELEALKFSQANAEVLPFSTAEGSIIGKFVIVDFNIGARRMSPTARLEMCDVSISLLEYVEPPSDIGLTGSALTSSKPVAQTPVIPSPTIGREVSNNISKGNAEVNGIKNTFSSFKKGTKSFKRTVREIKKSANNAKLLYSEARSKVLTTEKIVRRAKTMPGNLNEAIKYADNLSKIDSLTDPSSLEIRVNNLSDSSSSVVKSASPLTSFISTKEGGN